MRQLALGVKLRDGSRFSSYIAGPNAAAMKTLQALRPRPHSPPIWVYGSAGTGKTHLLQAVCAAAGERGESAIFLPLAQFKSKDAEFMHGFGLLSWVCLDDFEAVAADRPWQLALFKLYSELEQSGGRLLVGSRRVPSELSIGLPDLASRLNASLLCRLQPLDDEEQAQALRLRAGQRGMDLSDETAAYLLKRVPRNLTWLCEFLDALDEASLSAQRRLTIPFVREVLREHGVSVDEPEKG